MVILCYPKCSTCRKAVAFLEARGVKFTYRDIALDRPTEKELREWHARSGLPLKRFFNTSGLKYRELDLSRRLPEMSQEEQFSLLASDGMLVKRPLLVGSDTVWVGFKESEWALVSSGK